ncbi:MAG: branched-chain amino acid ABC transporter permease [Chloroflexi bacterium]|nr:branched-chain amino acid ABC transporter permease [Chloroflexota bacterium]
MSEFIQLALTGLAMGGIYALLALGVALIYKSSSVFNFAQGDFAVVGAYLVVTLFLTLQMPFLVAIVLSLAIMAGIGILVNRGAVVPLFGQPVLATIMMTLGLSIFLKGIVTIVWRNVTVGFGALLPISHLTIGDIVVSFEHGLAFVIALLVFGVFTFIFQRTKTGLALRAVAEDQPLAAAMGINWRQQMAIVWSIAATTATLGGVLLAMIVGAMPEIGEIVLLSAFPALLLGGVNSIAGALVGGLMIGLLQSMVAGYIDPLVGGGMKLSFPFIFMLVFLLLRPYGIFGERTIERI